MERLSERIANLEKGIKDMICEKLEVSKVFLETVCNYMKKLKAYKDAEEQGLLLKLPCKVGSELYDKDGNSFSFNRVYYYDGKEIGIIVINNKTGEEHRLNSKVIGKLLFLTKEAAEQALAETKGE